MKILGITINSELKVDEHIDSLIKFSLTSLYALRIMEARGLRKETGQKETEAIIMSRILYTAKAWWGLHKPATFSNLTNYNESYEESKTHHMITRQ